MRKPEVLEILNHCSLLSYICSNLANNAGKMRSYVQIGDCTSVMLVCFQNGPGYLTSGWATWKIADLSDHLFGIWGMVEPFWNFTKLWSNGLDQSLLEKMCFLQVYQISQGWAEREFRWKWNDSQIRKCKSTAVVNELYRQNWVQHQRNHRCGPHTWWIETIKDEVGAETNSQQGAFLSSRGYYTCGCYKIASNSPPSPPLVHPLGGGRGGGLLGIL